MTMVLMVAGVVIAIEPEILKSLFMFMLGGVVMLLGVWQYILLGQYRSVGVVVRGKFYITPSVLVVCGLVMMFFPQSSTNVVVCATGVLIALFGVTEIINFFALRIPVSQSNEPRIIIENE